MIWILCVVHVAYWLGAFGQPLSSLILFEMPIIFYISGSAISVSGKHRGLSATIVNRARRVLTPYYVLAPVCIFAFFIIRYVLKHDIYQEPLSTIILKALWPHDGSLPMPYTMHLWFVTPYLIVCCISCFQQKLADKSNRYVFLLALLGLCAVTQAITDNMLVRNVVFYNFFFMAGYLCYKKISIKGIAIIGACALIMTGVLYAFCWKGAMQQHKFPPDMLFVCYGIAALCIFGVIFSKIKIPQNSLLRIWNTNGYTIYLWQNVVFTIFGFVVARIVGPITELPQAVDFAFKSVSIFIIATALSFVAVPVERALIRFVTQSVDKIAKKFTDNKGRRP